jgi:hypothetical protein
MKGWLATQRFRTNEEFMDGVNNWLHNLAAPFFDEGTTKTNVTVRQVPKCEWQICGELM